MESVNGNYTKLTFDWHTGIRIGAYYGYGGTRFYNNSVGSAGSKIFSVGESDSNVRVYNDIRSPIFYDLDDTGYYCNPNGFNQLRYLRINATPAPEGAVAPGILYNFKDSVEQGEPINFALSFKNISDVAFDSLIKVKFIITDQNNVSHAIDIPKRKALASGDTLNVLYTIDTENLNLVGVCTLFIEFNPDNDQPEMYHYNNVLYKDFFVKADKYNPLLDVTFDGEHILNKDIVASKPQIFISLKDESKFLGSILKSCRSSYLIFKFKLSFN
jgi:hypothetical protein